MEISVSEMWAELQSLRMNWNEFLYQKQDGFWQRQSPVLFPIIGKLKGNQYTYEGKRYEMPQHGFLRDMSWDALPNLPDNELGYSFVSDEMSQERYPWEFEITIKYIIENTTLRVEYSIANHDKKPMPFSLWGHPAFQIGGDIAAYSVEFENDDTLESDTLDGWLISSKKKKIELDSHILTLSEELFSQDALILRNLQSRWFHLVKNGKRVFTFHSGNFPHFALWKQPNAPFLCFEPWQGYADGVDASGVILEKPGMVHAKPLEKNTYFWEVLFPQK